MKPSERLQQWLEASPGPWRIGQVLITRRDSAYVLTPVADTESFPSHAEISAIRALVREDASGAFRPLKAEPNLKSGWSFGPFEPPQLLIALDILYPTAVANWNEQQESRLRITPFRETAARQTGMYTIVKILTDLQVEEVQAGLCAKRCLKTRLWSGRKPSAAENEIPLLCPECCSLFISTCRAKLKGPSEEE